MNLKIRQEILDQDYINKLSDKEKLWLDQFNKEWVNASFKEEDNENRIHPQNFTIKVVKKTGKKRKVDIYKKDCEDRNNTRNSDVYGRSKINNLLKDETKFSSAELINRSSNYNDVEERLIDLIENLKDSNSWMNRDED